MTAPADPRPAESPAAAATVTGAGLAAVTGGWSAAPAGPPPAVPGYELLGELGRG
jgi:hypothetical protein